MSTSEPNETYSEAETEARREAILKRVLAMPPKPHKARKGVPKRNADTRGLTVTTPQRGTR